MWATKRGWKIGEVHTPPILIFRILTNTTSLFAVRGYNPLTPPDLLQHEIPQSPTSKQTVLKARNESVAILQDTDPLHRLLVIVGPCSIHDPTAALEYCDRLLALKYKYADDLLIIMRSYLEKPR